MATQGNSLARIRINLSSSGQTKPVTSVIKVSRSLTGTEFLKLSSTAAEGELSGTTIANEQDSMQRRELLTRRPSYRKLFNDLASEQQTYTVSKIEDDSVDGHLSRDSNDNGDNTANTIGISGQTFQIVSQDDSPESGFETLAVGSSTNAPASAGTVIQYTQGPDEQYFIPVHQIGPSGVVSFPQGIMVATSGAGLSGGQHLMEEASRKRELRLLKNKEAAKECRRKKKEYVRCLENRVAVLENQNKTLIEELKSLKELYCQKEVHSS